MERKIMYTANGKKVLQNKAVWACMKKLSFIVIPSPCAFIANEIKSSTQNKLYMEARYSVIVIGDKTQKKTTRRK